MPSAGGLYSPDPLNALLAGQSFINASSQAPLVSAAGTDGEIIAGSYTFVTGYAYEVTWFFRFTLSGAPATVAQNCRGAIARFRRASVSGTLIHSGGYVSYDVTASGAAGADKMNSGSFLMKRTGVTTVQTISMCSQFSSVAQSGSVAAMGISAGGTSLSRFTIKCIGLASNNSDAIEVPTS